MYQNINKIYHAAIYVRLSKEDGDISSSAKLESNSISNQKALILDFLKDKKDIEVVSVRVDDGYSGSNFERPAFQAMLEDIRHGIVDCVVVKDLSRFGREYIDSGKYIERLFPALGVRFIAINDNYDSLKGKNQADEIIIPFKNLINDAYCRDISIKIRSNLEIKRKKGECVTPFVAFGYRKTKTDKHKLEIDPSAGSVVQDIFKMKLQGMSQDAIANRLNELGILSPFEYKISSGSRYETGFRQKEQALWSSVTVRRILENEVYIGNLVQGKRTTPNHKVKQTYVKPEDDWIRIEKNHEPLVSDRDFEIVQRLLGMDTRTSPDQKQVYLLSGIAVCADCGAPMTRKVSTVAGKKYAYYLCSTNKETKRCSSHRIPEKDLEDAVLVMLKQHIQNILHLKRVLEFIGTVPFQEINMKKLQDRLEKKKQEKIDLSPARNLQPKSRDIRYTNMKSAMAEEMLLSLVLRESALLDSTGGLKAEMFSSELLGRVYAQLKQRHEQGLEVSLGGLTDLTPEEMSHIAGILHRQQGPVNEQALTDCIRTIQNEYQASKVTTEDDLLAVRERMKERKGMKA